MNMLKGIIYNCLSWFVTIGFRRKPEKKILLLIRVDEIGDYMLWRSFLKELITEKRAEGFDEIHFCGNQSWKTLFDTLDKDLVNHSVWIDKIRFKKEMGYRYRFLKNIYQQRYDTVINPTFSRDKRYDDSIVNAARA